MYKYTKNSMVEYGQVYSVWAHLYILYYTTCFVGQKARFLFKKLNFYSKSSKIIQKSRTWSKNLEHYSKSSNIVQVAHILFKKLKYCSRSLNVVKKARILFKISNQCKKSSAFQKCVSFTHHNLNSNQTLHFCVNVTGKFLHSIDNVNEY